MKKYQKIMMEICKIEISDVVRTSVAVMGDDVTGDYFAESANPIIMID